MNRLLSHHFKLSMGKKKTEIPISNFARQKESKYLDFAHAVTSL